MSYQNQIRLFYGSVVGYIALVIVLLGVFHWDHLHMSPFYGFFIALTSFKPKKKKEE